VSDNVVPFNRRIPPAVWSDGTVQTDCTEHVHLFASVPGRCKCGERLWTTLDPAPAEDGDPQPKEETVTISARGPSG